MAAGTLTAMRDRTRPPRVVILANRLKRPVVEALVGLRPWLRERARIVAEPDITRPGDDWVSELPEADLAIVLGGDGTLLAQARRLVDLDLAILGVNFGKIGFLAEFSVEDLRRHWERIAAGRCRISQRLVLDVQVFDADAADCRVGVLDVDRLKARSVAVNDAVITAGPPFRMIELDLAFDPAGNRRQVTRFAGDGVIVATSSGSTAYNTSAGGPILSPDIEALCVTPICPQSLAFRPVVVNASSAVVIRVSAANAGTALVIDGQVSVKLEVHEQVYVCRHPRTVRLIENPRHTYWWTLARKMHWAARPRRA